MWPDGANYYLLLSSPPLTYKQLRYHFSKKNLRVYINNFKYYYYFLLLLSCLFFICSLHINILLHNIALVKPLLFKFYKTTISCQCAYLIVVIMVVICMHNVLLLLLAVHNYCTVISLSDFNRVLLMFLKG